MTSEREAQQLGPNWKPHQFDHWRRRSIEALGPSATLILFYILDGVDTVYALRDLTDLSASCVQGHVRRLTGMGLVKWSYKRGEPIRPNCVEVNIPTIIDLERESGA